MNNEIEIICPNPKCSKITTVNLSTDICECGQFLTTKNKPTKYIKKPWVAISTTVAFLSGVASTVGGSYYLVKENLSEEKIVQSNVSHRYSINDEYLIINSCISEDERPLRRSYLIDKKEICVCALEKTQIAYKDDYKKNDLEFLNVFEKKIYECMNNPTTAAEPAAEASPY